MHKTLTYKYRKIISILNHFYYLIKVMPVGSCYLNKPAVTFPVCYSWNISPYVAAFSLVNNQQVSMDLVYELRCNPAQGHPNLVLCNVIIILQNKKCIKIKNI